MSAEITAQLITDDDREAQLFIDAVADFAMRWSNNVLCAATLRLPEEHAYRRADCCADCARKKALDPSLHDWTGDLSEFDDARG